MLKDFIKCASIEERLQLLQNSTSADWTDSQLNTAFEILGLPVNTNMSLDDKLKDLKNILDERAQFLANASFHFDQEDGSATREDIYMQDIADNSISKLAALYLLNSGAIAH